MFLRIHLRLLYVALTAKSSTNTGSGLVYAHTFKISTASVSIFSLSFSFSSGTPYLRVYNYYARALTINQFLSHNYFGAWNQGLPQSCYSYGEISAELHPACEESSVSFRLWPQSVQLLRSDAAFYTGRQTQS